jgi:hypothetical protein
MFYIDPCAIQKLVVLHVEAERDRARPLSLLPQGRRAQQGWLSRQGGWLLQHLGRGLVSLGERLERYSSPHTHYDWAARSGSQQSTSITASR